MCPNSALSCQKPAGVALGLRAAVSLCVCLHVCVCLSKCEGGDGRLFHYCCTRQCNKHHHIKDSRTCCSFQARCRGTVAQCIALLPHSRKVVGSSPALCNMSGLVPGPFVWSLHVLPVLTRVPPIEPHNKNMQKNRCSFGPVPDQDRTKHLDLVPGRRIAGRPLLLAIPGGGCQDGLNAENTFHRRPTLHVCVCVCVCHHSLCNECACRVALKRTCPPDFIVISLPVLSFFSVCHSSINPSFPLYLPVTAASQTLSTQYLVPVDESLWVIRIRLLLSNPHHLSLVLRRRDISGGCVWVQCEFTGIWRTRHDEAA